MYNAKKYLKIRKLESVLYGGPEVSELNYEKDASYIGDTHDRSRMKNDDKYDHDHNYLNEESEEVEDNTWYDYEYNSKENQVSFNLVSE